MHSGTVWVDGSFSISIFGAMNQVVLELLCKRRSAPETLDIVFAMPSTVIYWVKGLREA